jgi:hypothetical protein
MVRAALASDAPPKYQRAGKRSFVDAVEPEVRRLLMVDAKMPATTIAERIGRQHCRLRLRRHRGVLPLEERRDHRQHDRRTRERPLRQDLQLGQRQLYRQPGHPHVGNSMRGTSAAPATVLFQPSSDVTISDNMLDFVRIAPDGTGNWQNVSVRGNRLMFRASVAAAFDAITVHSARGGHGHSVLGNEILSTVAQPVGSSAIRVRSDDFIASPTYQVCDNMVDGFPIDLLLEVGGADAGQRMWCLVARNRWQANPVVTVVHSGAFTGEVVFDGNRSETLLPDPLGTPTSGRWQNGQLIYDDNPAAGGAIGWVCTTPRGGRSPQRGQHPPCTRSETSGRTTPARSTSSPQQGPAPAAAGRREPRPQPWTARSRCATSE